VKQINQVEIRLRSILVFTRTAASCLSF